MNEGALGTPKSRCYYVMQARKVLELTGEFVKVLFFVTHHICCILCIWFIGNGDNRINNGRNLAGRVKGENIPERSAEALTNISPRGQPHILPLFTAGF